MLSQRKFSQYQFYIQQGSNQPWYSRAVSDGTYRLHLNGTGDIVTLTSTGINVTGNVVADGMDLEIEDNNSGPVTIQQGGNSYFKIVTTNSSESVQLGNSTTNPDILLGGGNVGIGTTSPSPDYGSDIVLEVKGATSPGIVINDTGQASKYGIHADSNDLKITYGSGALVSFQNDGNVGIGTSSPTADLSIVDSSTGSGIEIQPEVTTNTNRITNYDRVESAYKKFRLDASEHAFYVSGTERFRIEDTGNTLRVGGTTNAGYIDFDGSSLQLNTQRNPNSGSFTNTGRAHAGITLSDGNTSGDSTIRFYTATSNNTAGTERMRLDHDGNLLVGKTSVANTGTGHVLRQSDSAIFTRNSSNSLSETIQIGRHASDGMVIRLNTGSSGNGTMKAGVGVLDGDGMYFTTGSSGTERVRIDSNGQIGISGSVKIGKNLICGGQTGFAGHIQIGDNVRIAAKSGVTKNIMDNSTIAGFPAIDIKLWMRNIINERKNRYK